MPGRAGKTVRRGGAPVAGKELGDQPPWRLVEPIVFRRRKLGGSDQTEPFSVLNPTLRRIPAAQPASHPARNSSKRIAGRNRRKIRIESLLDASSYGRFQANDIRLLCLSYAFRVLLNMI